MLSNLLPLWHRNVSLETRFPQATYIAKARLASTYDTIPRHVSRETINIVPKADVSS